MKNYKSGILEEVTLNSSRGGYKENVKIGEKVKFVNPKNYKFLEEKILCESLEKNKSSYGKKIDMEKIKENYRQEINLEREIFKYGLEKVKNTTIDKIGKEPYKIEQILFFEDSEHSSTILGITGKIGGLAFVNKEYFSKYKD